jgi:4-hydroxyphenylpyruvate dioxygenase-like putative hemolysin
MRLWTSLEHLWPEAKGSAADFAIVHPVSLCDMALAVAVAAVSAPVAPVAVAVVAFLSALISVLAAAFS